MFDNIKKSRLLSLQVNSERFLRPYPSRYMQRCTVFSLASSVCNQTKKRAILIICTFSRLNGLCFVLIHSFRGTLVPSIHEHELDEEFDNHGALALPRHIGPSVLQRVLDPWAPGRPRSHQRWMGNKSKPKPKT